MALAAGEAQVPLDREGYLKLANYPLIKQFDMNEEMRLEAVEICASGEIFHRPRTCCGPQMMPDS